MFLNDLQKALKKRFGCDWSFELDEEEDHLHVLRMQNDDDIHLEIAFHLHRPYEELKERSLNVSIQGRTSSKKFVDLTLHDLKFEIEDCFEKEQALWEAFKKLSSL